MDYFTIHAGVRLAYIPLTASRRHRDRPARRVDHGEANGASRTIRRKLSSTRISREINEIMRAYAT